MSAVDTDHTEVFVVRLAPDEAAALRSRAAAHGVSVEDEILALVEGAIQRTRVTEAAR